MRYDWDAPTYDAVSAPQQRWGQTVVSWLELRGDDRVLDAGCGTGRVTEAVLARLTGGTVIGLDGSPRMLAAARRRLAGYGPALRLVAADLCDPLPLAPASLDAVISTATFHWLPDHDGLFRRLAAAIRPGGQLVAQCGGAGNIASVVKALERVAPGEAYPWTNATPEETSRRLEQAEFTDIETWLSDARTRFRGRAELERFLATVILWPQLQVREKAEWVGFTARVAGQLPGLELDYVRLNIRARRR
jgi:trans-aconitate 2-methyltransferase